MYDHPICCGERFTPLAGVEITMFFTFDKRRNTTIKGGRILEAAKNRLDYVHIWKLTQKTQKEKRANFWFEIIKFTKNGLGFIFKSLEIM